MTATEPATGARACLARTAAVSYRHFLVLRRSPHRFFDVTVLPFVDSLLFGSLGTFIAREGGAGRTSAAYLLAGIVLWHILYQAQIAVSTGFLDEVSSRNLLSMMVTPIREAEYLAGTALVGLAKLVLAVAGVSAAAFLLYAFDVTTLGIGLIPIAAVLVVAGWALGLFVIGLVLRFGSGAEAFAWGIMFLIMPLSGVFYSRQSLPGFLQPVSAALPTTHAFAAGRSLLSDNAFPWHDFRLAAITTALLAALAVAFVARAFTVFLRRGYITRHM
ncbi:ABC transporter permease [Saccharothrix saharensis]|uniref:ABC transporter permease n=1 Tax=Saccharothrix saharensis TaxID=571190 RepID=UPI0036A22B57